MLWLYADESLPFVMLCLWRPLCTLTVNKKENADWTRQNKRKYQNTNTMTHFKWVINDDLEGLFYLYASKCCCFLRKILHSMPLNHNREGVNKKRNAKIFICINTWTNVALIIRSCVFIKCSAQKPILDVHLHNSFENGSVHVQNFNNKIHLNYFVQ